MRRDTRRVWPADTPPGSFHAQRTTLAGRGVNARILFVCPRGQRCGVFLGPVFEPKPTEKDLNVWGWDGNFDRPTLTPSINCISEKDGKPTGGCGWHGHIQNGVMTGA